jgi:hypothetical protein
MHPIGRIERRDPGCPSATGVSQHPRPVSDADAAPTGLLQQLKRSLGRYIVGNGGQREHDDPFLLQLQLVTQKKHAKILDHVANERKDRIGVV